MGNTNTVQVSALACRAAQECERQTQCKSLHWLAERRKVGKTNTVQVSALACQAAQEWERQTQCKSLQHWLAERRKVGKTNSVQFSALVCRARKNVKDKHSASLSIGLSSGSRVG